MELDAASVMERDKSPHPIYVKSDFIEIDFDESLKLTDYIHAGHCMIYANWPEMLFKKHEAKAAVLMQMRFDGHLGFPGGLINPGEDVVKATNREMEEEINIDTSKHQISSGNHVISHVNHYKKLITHFYSLEVTLDEFREIERRTLNAYDYGEETLGLLRVCLYTMCDKYRGFPAFLNNNFIGNSKEQLCQTLRIHKILTDSEIRLALSVSREHSNDNDG